MVPFYIIEL